VLDLKINLLVHLPTDLLRSLEGLKGFDKEAFVNVHESGNQVTSIRINPFKLSMVNGQWSIIHHSPLTIDEKVPWTGLGYYLRSRPSFTFDPLFHAGCYYVQEASSMFLEQALTQTVDLSRPIKVLDLAAAPGGKSTHILSLITTDSLLVSNEVIRSRANILNGNIVKWGCRNVIVTNNDPKDFQKLENYFDVIVVDAPCSGSGLFRREPEAIEEWSEQNVLLCSQRQQRILADVLPALKDGGVLVYSTCSYSQEEDERILNWLRDEFLINGEELIIDPGWNIVSSNGGYRFWPDKVKGEGFFIACFRKDNGGTGEKILPKAKPDRFSKQELEILGNYVKSNGLSFLRHGKMLRAISESLLPEISYLSTKFRVVNCGTEIGEIIKDKLVPEHAVAVSNILGDDVERIDLSYEQSIAYLKKKELELCGGSKGWSVVTYEGHPLGWINNLSNRINNYYPKELRILKD
jgi:16S rRNA C967 or C1407 C5-methylase (RsmB/RsmF family)/NOL1/NOP2/fmu family ribosome biogenesis protein